MYTAVAGTSVAVGSGQWAVGSENPDRSGPMHRTGRSVVGLAFCIWVHGPKSTLRDSEQSAEIDMALSVHLYPLGFRMARSSTGSCPISDCCNVLPSEPSRLEAAPKVPKVAEMGLVQIRRFWGNSTDDERALTVQGAQGGAATIVLGAAEEGVAEQLQPMRVRLPCQQFGRRLTPALGAIAAFQPAVVQVELQQGQIVRA